MLDRAEARFRWFIAFIAPWMVLLALFLYIRHVEAKVEASEPYHILERLDRIYDRLSPPTEK